VNVNQIGSIISALIALLFFLISLAGWRSRRAGREAKELRQVKEINIAVMSWAYSVRELAAVSGWKLPQIPKEMTPEYIQGKAEGEGNAELAQLADVLKGLAGKGDEK
jgi:hypothetical protein